MTLYPWKYSSPGHGTFSPCTVLNATTSEISVRPVRHLFRLIHAVRALHRIPDTDSGRAHRKSYSILPAVPVSYPFVFLSVSLRNIVYSSFFCHISQTKLYMTNRSISDEAALFILFPFFQKKQNVLAFDLAEHAVAEIIRVHRPCPDTRTARQNSFVLTVRKLSSMSCIYFIDRHLQFFQLIPSTSLSSQKSFRTLRQNVGTALCLGLLS